MNLEKIGGIIIILILILSIGLTVYSTTLNPTTADNSSNKSVTNITLTENQLIDELSKNDTPTNISVVNLNIKQKTGSIDINVVEVMSVGGNKPSSGDSEDVYKKARDIGLNL